MQSHTDSKASAPPHQTSARHRQAHQCQRHQQIMTTRVEREPKAVLTAQRGTESVGKTVTENKACPSRVGCAETEAANRVPFQSKRMRGSPNGATSRSKSSGHEKL